MYVIATVRAAVGVTPWYRVQMLGGDPQEKTFVQTLAPQVGERGATIGKGAAAPVVVLVEPDICAPFLD